MGARLAVVISVVLTCVVPLCQAVIVYSGPGQDVVVSPFLDATISIAGAAGTWDDLRMSLFVDVIAGEMMSDASTQDEFHGGYAKCVVSSGNRLARLRTGDTIGTASTFLGDTHGYFWVYAEEDGEVLSDSGNWRNQTGYYGLKIINGGDTFYGWARITTENYTNEDATLTVHEWAYNDTPGEEILAGQTVDRAVIQTQPSPVTAVLGGTATFEVVAEGEGTLTYQWRKGDAEVGGATSATLILDPVAEMDEGSYSCAVTNNGGTRVSDSADLTVVFTRAQRDQAVADAEADKDAVIAERDQTIAELNATMAGMYTQEELDQAVAEANPDSDGDGFTDDQEVERETDPNRYVLVLRPGWNLISLARVPDDNSVAAVLKRHNLGPVWTWNLDQGAYKRTDEIVPLQGHWVYVLEATVIEIILPDAVTVQVLEP